MSELESAESELLAALRTGSRSERERAALEAGRRGLTELAPVLIEIMTADAPERRAGVATALGSLRAAAAVGPLIQTLEALEGDSGIHARATRASTLVALGRIGDASNARVIERYLGDRSRRVREGAIVAALLLPDDSINDHGREALARASLFRRPYIRGQVKRLRERDAPDRARADGRHG